MTFAGMLDAYKWQMLEKGLAKEWNQLKQLSNSKLLGVTNGTTLLGALIVDSPTEANFVGTAGAFSGSLSSGNTGTGKKLPIGDPSGRTSPGVQRRTLDQPTNGLLS